jgi:hypothetical protein
LTDTTEDFRYERETPPCMLQQTVRSIAILYVCRQDAYAEQEPERVDKNMALSADNLLTRIETLRINRRPLFERPWRSGCR